MIRFINQKKCNKCPLQQQEIKKFNEKGHSFTAGIKIFPNQNLTPVNESIEFHRRQLERNGLIHECYSRNEVVQTKHLERT